MCALWNIYHSSCASQNCFFIELGALGYCSTTGKTGKNIQEAQNREDGFPVGHIPLLRVYRIDFEEVLKIFERRM